MNVFNIVAGESVSCKVVFFVPDFLCVRYHENLGSRSEHVLNVLGAGFDLQKQRRNIPWDR